MSSLLEIGLANAACAAALAVLALAAGRVCCRPAVRHGLWLLVLVKLITPPLLPLPVRVLPPAEAPLPAPVAVVEVPPAPPAEPTWTGQFLLLPPAQNGDIMLAMKFQSVTEPPPPVKAPPVEPAPVTVS